MVDAPPRDGLILAATGARYNIMARRAALTVRRVMPDLTIDLFTDTPELAADGAAPFAQAHKLAATHARPKMEALARSRFDRTLYIDCDVMAVNPFPEIFDLLDSYDMAAAHEGFGSAPISLMNTQQRPVAFRQINSGVIALRKSDRMDGFLARYARLFAERNARFDQPILAELIHDAPEIRLAVLPQEYNLMYLPYMRHAVPGRHMAPRLLHLPWLHKGDQHLTPEDAPYDPALILNDPQLAALRALTRKDVTLGGRRSLAHLAGDGLRRTPWLDRKVRALRDWLA